MNDRFLDKIVLIQREKVAGQKRTANLAGLKERAFLFRKNAANRRLHSAISRDDRINIIAEIKRASPSKGVINDRFDIEETARAYKTGDAAAISVLTEKEFFDGSLDDLIKVRNAVDLPVLRKDFIVDEFQIYEAATAGADAVLLIVAALTADELQRLLHLTRDELGMDALIETHTAGEMETAARVGADIIGVNNRDLNSLEVSLDTSRRLISQRPANALMIAESGISTRTEIDELGTLGYNGFLIGETLMRSGDPEAELKDLTTL